MVFLLIWGALICFTIGIFLIVSVIHLIMKEAKTKGQMGKDFLVVLVDVISDPISSEGLRILFGSVLIVIGILLLFL